MASHENTEPFPSLPQNITPGASTPQPAHTKAESAPLKRTNSNGSGPPRRRRTTSLTESFLSSNPPYGMWQATAEVASKIPTLGEIRKGSFCADGWTEEGQMEERGHTPHQIQRRKASRENSFSASRHRRSTTSPLSSKVDERGDFFATTDSEFLDEANRVPSTIPETSRADHAVDNKPGDTAITTESPRSSSTSDQRLADSTPPIGPDETGTYPNGYRFPPKHTWWQSTVIGLKAFWKFFLTPFGFLVTIYSLNVVAWGAMIFFVLLQAAPAMCHPSCSDPNSARQIWIEIDSQILNALFCVTGFGLIPWRFRDFYYLIQWRVFKKYDYFRRLAGHNRGWFRLPGSENLDPLLGPPPVYTKKNPKKDDSPPEWSDEEIAELEKNPAVPLPATAMPPAPLTGVRAPPTKPIMIDVVVWMYVLNTVFQACLAGAMWGLNRFTRPSWVTGFLITIGCIVAIIAGIVVFREGKKIKKVEGIPVEEREVENDIEKGQEALGLGNDKKVNEKSDDDQRPNGIGRQNGADGDAGRPALTRKTTEKTKGKHWYERH
ncbi:hypothetical protein EPUS_05381 [Endocarpon pusillum Z07020]|uniref:Uncharacterized protein n=1 Tax=Endocarpon pusillum (strain Z07020 / HMAS-L-300199) TaxID=1263415 RepID=U1GNS8_ENDPU|nr:uncharacterized protein EPUS_05381 [Endocarpon pusillum Z07020]ERF73958.1 hypothetical protein EPUS_05381 [Endocarpon pusillum Z07020]